MGKRFNRILRFVLLIVITSLAALAILKLAYNRDKTEYIAPIPPVKIEHAERRNIEQSITLNGYIDAEAKIPVVPFVAGTVEEYYVKVGDKVEKDQVLAVLDKTPYQLQFEQAQAAYLAADSTYTRMEKLVEVKAATQQNLEEIKAQRDAYKAQMDLAKVQLNYATVKAPVEGTILISASAKGSIASQQTPMFVIADLSKQVVKLNISEKYFTLINKNKETINAVIHHEDSEAKALITSISPYISPESKTFEVELGVTENEKLFSPGMFVTVDLVYNKKEDVLTLPYSARNFDGTLYYYDKTSQEAKMLDLSLIEGDDTYFILDEKYKDYWFITDGQGFVLDGQKVALL